MDRIIRRENLTEEERKLEEYFIKEATLHPKEHVETYKNFLSSLNGRYICSDLMKETFAFYTESRETRNAYNYIVHDSAATLTNELYKEQVKDENITDCIFLTGIPGAGKSFFVQSLNLEGEIPDNVMIYEGSITTDTIIDKISLARENNKRVHIIVINSTLELAYQNVLTRIKESGRGASIQTMAKIASGLYEAVKRLYTMFNNELEIGIYKKEENDKIEIYTGIEEIEELNIGSYEEVLKRLEEIKEEEQTYGIKR